MRLRAFSQVEAKEKKIEIAAVIDFCTAKGVVNFSKSQVFQFFGVQQRTASRWGFNNSYTPNRQRTTQPEATLPSISSAPREQSPPQSPPPKRQMPLRNDGRGAKKLKSMIEAMERENESDESLSPSTPPLSQAAPSPTPEEPRTPSKRRIAHPSKKHGLHSRGQGNWGVDVEIKSENFDEDVDV